MFRLNDFKLIILALLATFMFFKTVHFALFVNKKHLYSWFYFSMPSINNSTCPHSAKAKKVQNRFTFIIMIISLFYLLLSLLTTSINYTTISETI